MLPCHTRCPLAAGWSGNAGNLVYILDIAVGVLVSEYHPSPQEIFHALYQPCDALLSDFNSCTSWTDAALLCPVLLDGKRDCQKYPSVTGKQTATNANCPVSHSAKEYCRYPPCQTWFASAFQGITGLCGKRRYLQSGGLCESIRRKSPTRYNSSILQKLCCGCHSAPLCRAGPPPKNWFGGCGSNGGADDYSGAGVLFAFGKPSGKCPWGLRRLQNTTLHPSAHSPAGNPLSDDG